MDSSMIKGLVIGAVVVTAGGAIANYTLLGDKADEYAQVINVEEIKETVNTPREECNDARAPRG